MPEAKQTPSSDPPAVAEEKSDLIGPLGYVLGFSYPLLALSTGARALYQLFIKEGVTNYVGPLLTGVAAIVYLVAAVGFFRRTPRWWRIAVAALAFEVVLVASVGTLSILMPDVIGRTALGYFGRDYAFFPLIQPILGLLWLLYTPTKRAYGVLPPDEAAG